MNPRTRSRRLAPVIALVGALLAPSDVAQAVASSAAPDAGTGVAHLQAGEIGPKVLLMSSHDVTEPTSITTRSGLSLATWTAFDQELLKYALYSAWREPADDAWTEPIAISPRNAAEATVSQHVVVEQRGRPMVFWRTGDGEVLSNRLGGNGRWGAPSLIAQAAKTVGYLEAASGRGGDLAVSFYEAGTKKRVVWHKPFGDAWTKLPLLPKAGRAESLVVTPGAVSWGAEVPDPDSVTAAVVFTWSSGDSAWTADRVGPEPGRVWREPWEYAPI